MGCLGFCSLGVLAWAVEYTPRPSLPVVVAIMLTVVGLSVVPWTRLAAARLRGDHEADRLFRRVVALSASAATGGAAISVFLIGDTPAGAGVAMASIFAAGVVALVGAVLLPWIYLLARTITRERAARVRAEERAEVAAHLHDSVLQALTLIHKRTEEPEVRRLARGTERELRAWLFGRPSEDDFAAAIAELVAEVEDRYAVTVELVSVGSRALDARTRAVAGAVREALTNAAKHAGVREMSVLVEVTETEVFALAKDRGRGFDPSVHNGPHRRGIVDSIEGRVRQHGGMAEVRSIPGEGTEVELRMPL
ncbi:Signal transduction histidine kinase [Amycolatopsis xylanica]|uniref:Signal transduction histidine kinase n=1 Tax=Amycolatopsis xylanica TaxID=589385 RepID=A0A1H3IRM2_9PSEU|nr:Signal transduction histidine kinase [Amycolatopsis xylanica]